MLRKFPKLLKSPIFGTKVPFFRYKSANSYGSLSLSFFDKFIKISSFLEIDFEINISDKKSRRFNLSGVIFKCIKVL